MSFRCNAQRSSCRRECKRAETLDTSRNGLTSQMLMRANERRPGESARGMSADEALKTRPRVAVDVVVRVLATRHCIGTRSMGEVLDCAHDKALDRKRKGIGGEEKVCDARSTPAVAWPHTRINYRRSNERKPKHVAHTTRATTGLLGPENPAVESPIDGASPLPSRRLRFDA